METTKIVRSVKTAKASVTRNGAPAIYLEFSKSFPGFEKDSDRTNVGEVNHLNMPVEQLVQQASDMDGDIAIYLNTITRPYGEQSVRRVVVLLSGATITMTRSLLQEGDVIRISDDGEDVVADQPMFTTKVVDVKVTPKVAKMLESALAL